MAERLVWKNKGNALEPYFTDLTPNKYNRIRSILFSYLQIGTVQRFKELSDAEEQRNKGCSFCNDPNMRKLYGFPYCGECGRKLKEAE